MLKIMVEKPEVQDVIVPLRWCVDRETLDELRDRGVQDPYLLLVIVQRYHRPEHKLVPFNQMVEYVELQGPGENRIFATIVWNEKGRGDLWKRYLQRNDGRYNTDLVDSMSSGMDFHQPVDSIGKAELILEVPRELFAKEPRALEKRWVNFWFENKPKDQCQYRRRRALAYTIQPPAVLLWLVFGKILWRWVVFLLLIILGMWIEPHDSWSPKSWKPLLDWKPLFHPWRRNFRSLFTSDFVHVCREIKGFAFLYSVYFMLPLCAIYTLCSFLINCVRSERFGKILGVFGAVVDGFISKIHLLKLKPIDPVEVKRITEEREKVFLDDRYYSYRLLLCENVGKVEPRKVAPFKYKVYLRYMDLKASVCKPFAG